MARKHAILTDAQRDAILNDESGRHRHDARANIREAIIEFREFWHYLDADDRETIFDPGARSGGQAKYSREDMGAAVREMLRFLHLGLAETQSDDLAAGVSDADDIFQHEMGMAKVAAGFQDPDVWLWADSSAPASGSVIERGALSGAEGRLEVAASMIGKKGRGHPSLSPFISGTDDNRVWTGAASAVPDPRAIRRDVLADTDLVDLALDDAD